MLKKYIDDNPEIWDIVDKCMGVAQGRGVHAAGVVIACDPVHYFTPVMRSKDGQIVTEYTMKYAEQAACTKLDFLGLVGIAIVGAALQSIKEHTGETIEWVEFPHDDRVYTEIIQKDKVAVIFLSAKVSI